ncbi:MAG: cupredoxin domain-containing protein [Methanoregulaceae archaeon]|nr:cupredoxin domain-containing protein [Methanoregulaceae archaeon]
MTNQSAMIGVLVIVALLAFFAGCTGTPGAGTPTATPQPATTASPQTTVTVQPATTPATTAPATTSPVNTTRPATTTAVPTLRTVTVDLIAKGFSFNMNTINVPAGAKVVVNFDNQDQASHNFALYSANFATTIFKGEVITGPKKTTYTFTAPETKGMYSFRCDIHPVMNGLFIVQ